MIFFKFGLCLWMCMVNILHTSFSSEMQTFTWLKKRFQENTIQRFYKSFRPPSRIGCMTTCSYVYKIDRVYWKNNVCYCLALPGAQESVLEGQVDLLSTDFIYQVHFAKENCLMLNYTIFSGTNYCLKLFTTATPWYKAEEKCFQNGGHLVSTATIEKLNHVKQIRGSVDHVYLGGVLPPGSPNTNHFTWLSGEHVKDSWWSSDEPNSFPVEDVVEMYRAGYLNNKRNTHPFPFICEILIY